MGRWKERIFGTGIRVSLEEGRVVWKEYHPSTKVVRPPVGYPFEFVPHRFELLEVEIPGWYEIEVGLEDETIIGLEVWGEIFQRVAVGDRIRITTVSTVPRFLGIPLSFLRQEQVTVEVPGGEFV